MQPFIIKAFPEVFCFTSGKTNSLMFSPFLPMLSVQLTLLCPLVRHFTLGLQIHQARVPAGLEFPL